MTARACGWVWILNRLRPASWYVDERGRSAARKPWHCAIQRPRRTDDWMILVCGVFGHGLALVAGPGRQDGAR